MIVYVGNMLSQKMNTVGVVELLAPKFRERYEVVSVSEKKNQCLRMLHMLYTVFRFRRKAKVVVMDSYSSMAFWYCYMVSALCRMYKIPYVPVLHGGNFPERLENSPRATKKVFANSYINISPSHYLEEAFTAKGFKVKYIPNFLDISNYPFTKREKFSPKIFWVRAFHTIYNPLMALEVLKLVKEKYNDADLCMVGGDKDGIMKTVMEKCKEMQLENAVTFTGFISKKEIAELSKTYSVFINTTNFDNQPVSVIEAMALGLPVVSTSVGGVPFLIENMKDGILVEKNNAQQMADAIIKLLNENELAKSIAANARAKAESFDWQVVKERWWRVLELKIID